MNEFFEEFTAKVIASASDDRKAMGIFLKAFDDADTEGTAYEDMMTVCDFLIQVVIMSDGYRSAYTTVALTRGIETLKAYVEQALIRGDSDRYTDKLKEMQALLKLADSDLMSSVRVIVEADRHRTGYSRKPKTK